MLVPWNGASFPGGADPEGRESREYRKAGAAEALTP